MKPNQNLAVFKIHNIRAILFDKDGTILDFYNTWRPMWDQVMEEMNSNFNLSSKDIEEIHEILGVTEDGFTSDSVFVKDNFSTIMQTVMKKSSINDEKKEEINKHVETLIEKISHPKAHVLDGVEDMLKVLKEQGFIIGLVTSDLEEIGSKHLKDTGLMNIFDYIAYDDGIHKVKPHPDTLVQFCKQFDLMPHEIAMVGDTMIDMQFAKNNNMGYAVYVKSGYPDVNAEKMADMILENANQLIVSV